MACAYNYYCSNLFPYRIGLMCKVNHANINPKLTWFVIKSSNVPFCFMQSRWFGFEGFQNTCIFLPHVLVQNSLCVLFANVTFGQILSVHTSFLYHFRLSVLGDTTFEVFISPPTPDLFKVKVLICEATYIDDDVDRHGRSSAERAQERGHCHLFEFCEHEHLFQEVEHIILVHMSDKYSPGYIKDHLFRKLPQSLENKVLVGNFFKETLR